MARNNGIMGPWEWHRRAGFVVGVLGTFLFLVVLVSFPVGVAALLAMVIASFVWKPIGAMSNPTLGTYRQGTYPFRIAEFFTTYRIRLRTVLSPLVCLGFGPPTDDPDHQLLPGWWPPSRLSAYWCLVVAVPLGCVDLFIDWARHPFWGFSLPSLLLAGISTIGWFALLQSIVAVRRINADGGGIGQGEPAPAVMLTRAKVRADLPRLVATSFGWGLIPAFVFAVLWVITEMSWTVAVPLIVASLMLVALVKVSRMLTTSYRAGWRERNDLRAQWAVHFAFMRDKAPFHASQMELPLYEEWVEANPDAAEKGIPYAPQVTVATFAYPPNGNLDDYVGRGYEDRVKGEVHATAIAFSPIGIVDPNTGQELPGTVGTQGMRVWWTMEPVDIRVMLNPSTDNWLRELAVRSLVMSAVSRTRGLGTCTLLSCGMMTRPSSSTHIIEIQLVPPHNVSMNNFLSAIRPLSDNFGGLWVRVYKPESADAGSNAITLMVGDDPENDPQGIRFVNPATLELEKINIANWNYYFHATGVVGSNGTPRLQRSRQATPSVRELLFDIPPGMDFSVIASRVSSLRSTSGNAFLEMTQGRGSMGAAKKGMRQLTARPTALSKIKKESQDTALFTVTAAREDPLVRPFPFRDYRDQIILGRVPGKPQIDWATGVLGNDEMSYFRWDDDLPHLLLAGASGAGKSNVLNSMICQLVANNGPDCIRLRLVEPKNELQSYRHLDVVDRFVDSWYPNDDFFGNVGDMLEDTVNEMNRRYRLMKSHPRYPKKLSTARDIAMQEGPQPDGSPHPFMLPYEFVIIEECATVFADSASKEERNQQARILQYAAELARKSRAAGIHLVFATQYPTNASIPSVLRQQCRRIGLRCQDALASRVIIGENGLEDIRIKGAGKISSEYGYRNFRGFYMQEGDPHFGGVNDVNDIVDSLPSNDWMRDEPADLLSFGGGSAQIVAPAIGEQVYERWSLRTGVQLDRYIDSGKRTRDILDDDPRVARTLGDTIV